MTRKRGPAPVRSRRKPQAPASKPSLGLRGQDIGRSDESGQEALDELADMTFGRMFAAMQSLPANATLDIFAGRLLKNAQWAVARAQAQAAGFDGTTSTTPSTLIQVMNSERSTGAITFEDEMVRLRALTQTMSEPAQRLLLDRIGGKTVAELAEESGESPDAIQQRYADAQAEFRAAMAERASGAGP